MAVLMHIADVQRADSCEGFPSIPWYRDPFIAFPTHTFRTTDNSVVSLASDLRRRC